MLNDARKLTYLQDRSSNFLLLEKLSNDLSSKSRNSLFLDHTESGVVNSTLQIFNAILLFKWFHSKIKHYDIIITQSERSTIPEL